MTSGDSNLEKSAFEKADKFLGNDTKKTHKSSVGGFDDNCTRDDRKCESCHWGRVIPA